MNILHHKSYHVYNKKNIEKVKKDEAEAEKQAKKKQDRVTLAESESRLTLLRQRASVNLPGAISEPIQHINLFQDLAKEGNQEHEAEIKEKDDQWNKQITMYLEKGTEKAPWYAKDDDKIAKYQDHGKFKRRQQSDYHQSRKKKPIQLSEDPLVDIKQQLKSREIKEKKDKYYTKRKDKTKTTESSSIEALRKKRMERERNERHRVEKLYLGPNKEETEVLDERDLAYNSQFNKQETDQAHKRRR